LRDSEGGAIQEAFATLVVDDIELLDVYLAGTPLDKLLREITCGDMGLEGAKVIVPSSQYDLVISRIDTDVARERYRVILFLSRRCDSAFLARYLSAHPDFVASLRVGSYLRAVDDVALLLRLHEYGLLPERKRAQVVVEVSTLAVQTPDSYFLSPAFRQLFQADELNRILARVRDELLPGLDDVVHNWRWNYDRNSGEPDEYYEPLRGALRDYKFAFPGDLSVAFKIDSAVASIEEAIEGLGEEEKEKPRKKEPPIPPVDSSVPRYATRSIFDDVDK
jgi:hypothetical protein